MARESLPDYRKLSDYEWNIIARIIANSSDYLTFKKMTDIKS